MSHRTDPRTLQRKRHVAASNEFIGGLCLPANSTLAFLSTPYTPNAVLSSSSFTPERHHLPLARRFGRIRLHRGPGLPYRGASPIRTGSDENESFFEGFFSSKLRTCNLPFLANVLNFKNVPPTVFPAFLKSKTIRPQIAYPSPKMQLAHFRAEHSANISLKMRFPSGGAFKCSLTGIPRVSENAT